MIRFIIMIFFLIISAFIFFVHSSAKNLITPILYGGINDGGIVMIGKVDGVTGATKMGGHAGLQAEFNLWGNYIQTGIDYLYYAEDIIYNDPKNSISGTRSFALQTVSFPVTYNLHFFNRSNGTPILVLSLGVQGSYFLSQDVRDSGTLSGYQLKNYTFAPLLRFSVYPFNFLDQYSAGVYLNVSRTFKSQFYSDDYYSKDFAGDVVTLDLGIALNYLLW